MPNRTIQEIALLFSRAFNAKDLETLADLYSDDLGFFLNITGETMSRQQSLASIGSAFEEYAELAHTDQRFTYFEDGYVMQCVTRLTDRIGAGAAVPMCLIVRVQDGEIVRVDEYFDSAQLHPRHG